MRQYGDFSFWYRMMISFPDTYFRSLRMYNLSEVVQIVGERVIFTHRIRNR